MAIGEFEEVGTTVRELASDDATLVIGTVLDPELKGELRVTMVATGIGDGAGPVSNPYRLVAETPGTKQVVNYDDLDAPTVIRNRREGDDLPSLVDEKGMEYLEIPAFLRKQAD